MTPYAKPSGRMGAEAGFLRKRGCSESVEFGLRWIVEIVISAFKRVLGESVRALKQYTAFIGIATNIAAYNRYLDID